MADLLRGRGALFLIESQLCFLLRQLKEDYASAVDFMERSVVSSLENKEHTTGAAAAILAPSSAGLPIRQNFEARGDAGSSWRLGIIGREMPF